MRHIADSRSEKGQTMVEFAMVLPILCVLLFGVIQFGILFNNYITLTDAVRAGARKAIVSRALGAGGAVVAARRSRDRPRRVPVRHFALELGDRLRTPQEHDYGACRMKRFHSERGQAFVVTVM